MASSGVGSGTERGTEGVVKGSMLDSYGRALMLVGFWLGIWATANAPSVAVACIGGGIVTVFVLALIAWDVRKAWKRHRRGEA